MPRLLDQIENLKNSLFFIRTRTFELEKKCSLASKILIGGYLFVYGLALGSGNAVAANQADAASESELKAMASEPGGHYWVDLLNVGVFDDYNVLGGQFNFTAKQKQWTVGVKYFDHFGLSSYEKDRASGEKIDNKMREFSFGRMWHRPARYGYTSLTAGLSVLQGEIGTDCSRVNDAPTSFYRRSWNECKRKTFTAIGLPLRASAGFGRYVGLAIHLDINLNVKEPYALISLSIPIGTFAR